MNLINNASNDNTYDAQGKKKAAYALNLCTVSVSQIIDYNDIYVMEQEYDVILNNLNLQNYIKDEALLDILKKILDTVTFFKIQEGDKQMFEKEYQHKMKNAIWTAVPNFGVLLAGGHPVQMAITLATQVGIGYMNYRKNKSQYELDREKQNWELHRNAIEQLNSLRQELFVTAWRLSDKFNFDDALRLTTKQIKSYNDILLDPDPLRRFERLESISNNYEAFPPFWYYKGNAAREVLLLDDYKNMHEHFNGEALKAYKKFDDIYVNFMREDLLAASCALEHISLLDCDKDADKILQLLNKAISLAGDNFDVLQMCVIIYSYLGRLTDAEKILRRLINENYNLGINGLLLSRIYCKNNRQTEYDILVKRIGTQNVLPWFDSEEEANEAEKNIIEMGIRENTWTDRFSTGWGKKNEPQYIFHDHTDEAGQKGKNKSSFECNIEKEYERQKKALQMPNLMVVGVSGAGKSSLINRIFGKDVAPVGAGVPITKGINKYETEKYPVVFWDTEGYEVSGDGTKDKTNFDNVIKPQIEKMNSGELKDRIHLVWYCIPISNHRVTDYDKSNIQWFKEHNMKIAIVFTKCDNDNELPNGRGMEATGFKDSIERVVSGLRFFETCAEKEDLLFDLEDLLDWSVEALPNDQMRQSFVSAQKISIKEKRKIAYSIVGGAAATTAATAVLNPLPLADTILIVPQQLTMAIALSKIFMFDSVTETAGNVLKTQLAAIAGRQIAAGFLKFVPLVGQVVNAVVAGAITYGLGMALTEAYSKAYEQFLETGKLPDWTVVFSSDIFVKNIYSFFREYKDRKGEV